MMVACGQTYVFWHKEREPDRGAPSKDDIYKRDERTKSLLKIWRRFRLGLEECGTRFTPLTFTTLLRLERELVV